MLAKMKTKLAASRALLYETTKIVDLRNSYNHIMDHGTPEEQTADVRENSKYYSKLAAALTPMSKALSTEPRTWSLTTYQDSRRNRLHALFS